MLKVSDFLNSNLGMFPEKFKLKAVTGAVPEDSISEGHVRHITPSGDHRAIYEKFVSSLQATPAVDCQNLSTHCFIQYTHHIGGFKHKKKKKKWGASMTSHLQDPGSA